MKENERKWIDKSIEILYCIDLYYNQSTIVIDR